jgi:CRP/FNR family transcriptional regulator, cyclic AMP receptor protein
MTAPVGPVSLADLEAYEFVKDLGKAFLSELVPHAERREYATGVTIAREGDVAHEFFLIGEGKVALEMVTNDRPRLTVLTLGPGEVFGWSWLVPPHRWRVDARALKPTRVLVISGPELRRSLEAHPTDGFHFLRRLVPVLAQRLDATFLQVLDVHRP